MTFQKIKSGLAPFDNLFQGFYLNRPTLLSGRRRSGTSTLALRFLSHILQIGEKILLFTEESPDHVTLEAHGLGTDVSEAIAAEQLAIVPYDRHLPLLPFPEALDELRVWLADRHFAFVVFDPVIPWLAAPPDRLEDRLNAFFGLLDDSGATSLLILRHPVSALARRLTDEVSERCAICLEATHTPSGPRALNVTKYMGAPPEKCPTVLQLAAATPETSPYQGDGMSLRELHKATQRININVPSYLPSSPHLSQPPTFGGASGFPSRTPRAPAAPASPVGASRPAAPARPTDDLSLFAIPPISRTPSPVPPAAPQSPPPARAPAATPATPIAPMPSPFHTLESKTTTQPIPAAPPTPRRTIHFSDAEPSASRPHEAPPASLPPPAPPAPPAVAPRAPFPSASEFGRAAPVPPPPSRPPVPPPAAPPAPPSPPTSPDHPIRFSDIIQ